MGDHRQALADERKKLMTVLVFFMGWFGSLAAHNIVEGLLGEWVMVFFATVTLLSLGVYVHIKRKRLV